MKKPKRASIILQIFRPQQLKSNDDLEALPIHTQVPILPKDLPSNYTKGPIIFQKPCISTTLVIFT